MTASRAFAVRRTSVLAALVLVVAGCSTAASPSGPQSRTIFVDWSHDEFAGTFIRNFPLEVDARPGDTLVFKQSWTGEPHTVTFGTLVDKLVEVGWPFVEAKDEGRPLPDGPPADVMEAMKPLPEVWGDDGPLVQTAAQACEIAAGQVPPMDGSPCPDQDLGHFDGTQPYYNSGVIPYEGAGGNEFNVKLAPDIEPGTYGYYCAVHGVLQSGRVVVREPGAEIASEEELRRSTFEEINRVTGPLVDAYRKVVDTNTFTMGEETVGGPFAGIGSPDWHDGFINEFIPRKLSATTDEPITWKIIGFHTISFNVPRYFPIVEFLEDGTVRVNPQLEEPAGGAPAPPVADDDEDGPPGDGPPGDGPPGDGPPGDGPPPEPLRMDAGEFDGTGFWSSGLVEYPGVIEYSLRITEPGIYEYACLLHPRMVGTVEVEAA